MRIPIHTLLEQLGITNLEAKSPQEIEALKKELDKMIAETDTKKEAAKPPSGSTTEITAAYRELYKDL